jgi:tape measure domain-containing protein
MAIGKLLLKLGIDTTNLDKELGKVEKSMSKFGQNMSNLGSTLTQSLTLPIIGVGAAALKSFADMEKLENGLIAIMGSSEGAAIELEKLRKVAENPGLALPEVVKASASLQSVGMNADAARETITQFGNAVARAGGGAEQFDGVVLALSQISAVGKVTQEDLNQIKERLPEFARVMKEEFGVVTAEGIRELGISSEEFIQRSVGALGNLERANGGLANTFDNLKDNVGASLAELGKAINETLNLEAVAAALSAGLQRLVDGFKSLNPETQGFIVKAGLLVAAIGPAIFIVGKLISTFGALIGTTRLIMTTVKNLSTVISGAFAKILANPAILGVTLAIAAVGSIALYVYDNWQAFSDRFKNIWINIKNSVMQGVTFVLGKLDSLQKALGLDLFDLSGMTKYQEEQRVVAAEFKTIGETVDSLKGKFKSLFMAAPGKGGGGGGTEGTGELVFGDGGAPTGGGTGGGVRGLMPSTNLLPSLNLLPTQLDSATASTQRLKSEQEALNQATTKVNSNFKEQLTQIELLKLSFNQLNTGLKNIIEGTLQDMAVAFGETLGQSLAGASFDIRSVIGPLADALIQFGKLAVQVGIAALGIKAALKSLNPAIAIAGGIALIALGTFVKSKLAAPALAQGGLATGPTMALVGDNRNARVDPEVIAPLSKLKSMMGDMGIGGTLETRISGNDLIILLNRSQKGLNRVQ